MNISDLMRRDVPPILTGTRVANIARALIDLNVPGLPVVGDDGELRGIVTLADLVVKHANVHVPTYLGFLGGVLSIHSRHQDEEIRKVLATTAADLMSDEYAS